LTIVFKDNATEYCLLFFHFGDISHRKTLLLATAMSKTLIFEFLISLFGKISPVKKNLLGVEISPILKDKKYSSKIAFLVCCHIESQWWLVRVLGGY
jgi:hypothetical protein